MRQVAIVVEGQTEEAFVQQVLAAYVGSRVHLQPIITKTKVTARGAYRGGGAWSHYRDILRRLIHQPHWSLVTTLIDFYAFPADGPGRDCHPGPHPSPRDCARARSAAMAEALPGPWLPFVLLHEFETLVIAAGSKQDSVLGDERAPLDFRRMIEQAGEAELVDDGQDSAPSKRVQARLPGYRKARDGAAVVGGCDLSLTMQECPGFGQWVDRLRG